MLDRGALRGAINSFSFRYAALLGAENALVSPAGICAALLPLLPAMERSARLEVLKMLGLEGDAPETIAAPRFLSAGDSSVRTALAAALFYERAVGLNAAFTARSAGLPGQAGHNEQPGQGRSALYKEVTGSCMSCKSPPSRGESHTGY